MQDDHKSRVKEHVLGVENSIDSRTLETYDLRQLLHLAGNLANLMYEIKRPQTEIAGLCALQAIIQISVRNCLFIGHISTRLRTS
jgi:hypothetical protein